MSFSLLKQLSDAHGISGREDEVRAVIITALAELDLSAEEDALGSLFVEVGGDPDGPAFLLDAHIDEVGLMVSHLHSNGAIGFATMGGWDERSLPAHEVTIRTRRGKVRGVIGSTPPHILSSDERGRAFKVESLWIDVATNSRQETEALGVRVGDPVVLDGECIELRDGIIRGKALDDRVGCYVILETLRRLKGANLLGKDLGVRLFASFSTSEEVGLRGIRAIGNRMDFAGALHLECTVAADVPGVPAHQCPSEFGKGAAISIADRSVIVPERMIDFLTETARANDILIQFKTPTFGGTNAGAMHMSGTGVLCGIVSAPARYIHSPVTLLKQSDLEHTIRLTVEAVKGIKTLLT